MAPTWFALTRGLNVVQFAWVVVLALVITVTATSDVPTAAVGAAVAIVLLAVAGGDSLPRLHSLTSSAIGPPREERRLRGAFRRQSAPNTPGRPRQARAPGQIPAVA